MAGEPLSTSVTCDCGVNWLASVSTPASRERIRQVAKTKDVRAAVEAELGFDPLVDSADITVMNIGGNVNLTGTVPSYPQYLEAAAAVRRVAGVATVDNNLEVMLPDGDFRDDSKLTTAANITLAANITMPDGVVANAHDGNSVLPGTLFFVT